jgi:hypothetical protein
MFNIISRKSSWLLTISGLFLITVILSCAGPEKKETSQAEVQGHTEWSKNARMISLR